MVSKVKTKMKSGRKLAATTGLLGLFTLALAVAHSNHQTGSSTAFKQTQALPVTPILPGSRIAPPKRLIGISAWHPGASELSYILFA